MKLLLELSKENISMAVEEVLRVADLEAYDIKDNLMIIKPSKDIFSRLAYTKSVYEIIGNSFEDVDWDKIIKGSYRVRAHDGSDEKIRSAKIWKKVKDPKVDLKNPDIDIHVFLDDLICRKLYNIPSFSNRKAHLRTGFHPSSLDPKLARFMVNISGVKKGRLLDPFCGTGGILIEAGLLGYKISGQDIDPLMIERCSKNLNEFGIKGFNLALGDSTKYIPPSDVEITDPPYGKSTRHEQNLETLYAKFLDTSNTKMVIGFPSFLDYETIISNSKYKILDTFEIYIHKSMSKIINVLFPRNQ